MAEMKYYFSIPRSVFWEMHSRAQNYVDPPCLDWLDLVKSSMYISSISGGFSLEGTRGYDLFRISDQLFNFQFSEKLMHKTILQIKRYELKNRLRKPKKNI